VENLELLDLGCGAGGFDKFLLDKGARSVTGVDISGNMLDQARKDYGHIEQLTWVHSPLEEYEFSRDRFDGAVSSLAFHYIEDYADLIQNIEKCLCPGGFLIFSVEHPYCTCAQGIHPFWIQNQAGEKLYRPVDAYCDEGPRKSHWFVDGVVRYHRKMETYLNGLTQNGFILDRVLEPHAIPEAAEADPDFLDERRAPPFLFIKASKPSLS
jgi:SAM-dependent methyltransferase